jgi:hypothetical protein
MDGARPAATSRNSEGPLENMELAQMRPSTVSGMSRAVHPASSDHGHADDGHGSWLFRSPDAALFDCAPNDVRPLPAFHLKAVVEVGHRQ